MPASANLGAFKPNNLGRRQIELRLCPGWQAENQLRLLQLLKSEIHLSQNFLG